MLDQTLSTFIQHIDQYCSSSEEIEQKTCQLYERLLNLERSKKGTTKLNSVKRRASSFMTEVIELARSKPNFKIGKNRINLEEAEWIGFLGNILSTDTTLFPIRDLEEISEIKDCIIESPLKSKCILYWIINTFNTSWMDKVREWMHDEKVFYCSTPHQLIKEDLKLDNESWNSLWFNLDFNAELFERYINQRVEKESIIIRDITRKEIEYVKQIRP